jgi:hypothetical protein
MSEDGLYGDLRQRVHRLLFGQIWSFVSTIALRVG